MWPIRLLFCSLFVIAPVVASERKPRASNKFGGSKKTRAGNLPMAISFLCKLS